MASGSAAVTGNVIFLVMVPRPGAFKLDHLQPVKPILFPTFSNFYIFILGSQFLLPQREEG